MLIHELTMSEPLDLGNASDVFGVTMAAGEVWEYCAPIASYIAQGDSMVEADPEAGAMFVPAGRPILIYPGYEAGNTLAAIIAVAETEGTATLTRMRLVSVNATKND